MDRVTGSRVKVHLLFKGGEQGKPLKNEFRVTEPAPEAQEVKRGGLGEGGGGRGRERSSPGDGGENSLVESFRTFSKVEEENKENEKGKLAGGCLETRQGAGKSISISLCLEAPRDM